MRIEPHERRHERRVGIVRPEEGCLHSRLPVIMDDGLPFALVGQRDAAGQDGQRPR